MLLTTTTSRSRPPAFPPSPQAVFAAVVQALRERSALLQSLEQLLAEGAGPDSPRRAPASAGAAVVRAALGAVGGRVEQCLKTAAPGDGEMSEHIQAARALGLLAEYVEGFEAVAQAADAQGAPASAFCAEVCRGDAGIVPWAFLREVTLWGVWRPMQDDAVALVPPVSAQLRPSEAVLVVVIIRIDNG